GRARRDAPWSARARPRAGWRRRLTGAGRIAARRPCARVARRRVAYVALLERVGALRTRPGGSGRRAHSSRRPRHPTVGATGAARGIGVTTAAALMGRLLTGFVVDRVDRRRVASATLGVQMLGLGLLATASSAGAVYAGCVLFGFGVGNTTTLP